MLGIRADAACAQTAVSAANVPAEVAAMVAPTQAIATSLAPQRFQLANGLTVILEERHGLPQIALRMIVNAGRRDQPPGHAGLAHMLEHLMFERSLHGSAEYSVLLESLGGIQINGETSDNETVYHAVIPAHRLAEMLWLESDRLGYLLSRLDQATLDAQRRVVQSEHRERVDDVAGSYFFRFVNEAWYPVGHPLRDLFEYPEDVAAIRVSDLQWFFQRWYVPSNVTLVLVGDFESGQTRRWIDQYFGSIVNAAVSVRPATPPVVLTSERRMVVEAPAGNRVLVRWPSPACLAPGDADATVAAFVLSGTAHSRLDRRMIHDLDIASDLAATQSGETDAGAFMITASAGDDHTNEEIMREIDAALEVIRTQPVAQAEFNGAKRRVIALARRQGLTLESRAEQLAAYAQFTARPLDLASEEIRLLEQTTPQSVLAFTQQWLTPEHRLVAMLRRAYREERRGVLVRGPARLTPRNALQASHGATNGDDK